MTEQERVAVLTALQKLCSAAHSAVSHVGASNYDSREREAHRWVSDAYASATASLKVAA